MTSLTIAKVADLQVDGDWDETAILEAETVLKNKEGRLPPIVLDPKNRIIQGATTVLAARRLGISMLAATIVSDSTEAVSALHDLPEETDRTDVPTATLLDTDGQKRTFHIEGIQDSSVVIGGNLYPIVDVELNEIAIALLDDEQLISAVNAEADLAFLAVATGLTRARKAGAILAEKRLRTKKDGWTPWLRANCPQISNRTAQDWMQVARNWHEIEKNAMHRGLDLSSLSMNAALKLLRSKDGEEGKGDKEASVPPNQLKLPLDDNTPTPVSARLPTLDEICEAYSFNLPTMPAGRVHWAARTTLQALAPKATELSDGQLLELNREAIALARIAKQLLEERNVQQAS